MILSCVILSHQTVQVGLVTVVSIDRQQPVAETARKVDLAWPSSKRRVMVVQPENKHRGKLASLLAIDEKNFCCQVELQDPAAEQEGPILAAAKGGATASTTNAGPTSSKAGAEQPGRAPVAVKLWLDYEDLCKIDEEAVAGSCQR